MQRSKLINNLALRRLWIVMALLALAVTWDAGTIQAQSTTVRMVYFYANDCPHCKTIMEELLAPLQNEYGDQMAIKMVEISNPENYELMINAEEKFDVEPQERGLPMLIIGKQTLIGEEAIRERLPCLFDTCLEEGGTSWPNIPGLETTIAGESNQGSSVFPSLGNSGQELEPCDEENEEACEGPAPIWITYFYQVGCQECSRAEYDIQYAQSEYPQLMIRELDVQENTALAEWLGERFGVPEEKRLATPALFVGEDYLIGDEITSDAILALAEKYAPTGAERPGEGFNPQVARQNIIERFQSFGALTVVFAGLVDGLNPCAFATLVFFVSYLTLSGREGKEVLVVGAAFTLGVFLAYLAVGLGLYKVLGMLGDLLTRLGRWVYGFTAVLCAGLALFSFKDFLKARQGEIGDMSLNLPHNLRKRINSVIRRGRKSETYVLGALGTGVIVSLLELACTGQVYLPTIIFVTSVPELRGRAIGYLTLYNLLFVLPLVVVFILAYYGTTSKELSKFLQSNAATVKLGMVALFGSLAVWLGLSLI